MTAKFRHAVWWIMLLAAGAVVLWMVDARVAALVWSSAKLAAGSCLVALPLGALLAVVIVKTDAPGRSLAGGLLLAMIFLPVYLYAAAWDAGFGMQGWYTLAKDPGRIAQPLLEGWRAAMWVHAMAAIPWVVLIVGAGLRAVEPELEEDALLDAPAWRVLLRVTLPRAAIALWVAMLWVVVLVTGEMAVTDLFQVRTFAEEVYTQSALGVVGLGLIDAPVEAQPFSARGLWCGVVLVTLLATIALASGRRLLAAMVDPPARAPWVYRLGRGRWPVAVGVLVLLTGLAGVPLGNLVYKAGVRVTSTDTGRQRTWSAGKAGALVAEAPRRYFGESWQSAQIGGVAATLAVAVGVPLAWSLRQTRLMPWGRFAALAACLAIPGPVLGLLVIGLVNRPLDSPLAFLTWLYDETLFAPCLVQTVRALPIAAVVLWSALATVSQATVDSARTEGAGWWQQMGRVVLPQRWPAVAAAWLLALAVAVGELAATILVMPPRPFTTLTIRIFQQLHYGVEDRVASICLALVLTLAVLTTVAFALVRRRRQ